MKKFRYLIVTLILGSLMTSCDFLNVDKYFDDTIKFDSIFSNKINLEKYLWGIPTEFPDEGDMARRQAYTPGVTATDEAFTRFTDNNGIKFTLGEISAADSKSFNIWGKMYKIIRKCNLVFSRIDEAKDLTALERFNILSYSRFMRAYAYYHLLMQYGPFVIVGDEIYNSNEEAAYYNNHRATYDECVDYICDELEEASKYMPETVSVNYFGRPTKGAAYGLIARLRLQQASPLFNGGAAAKKTFGGWKRSIDDVNYISQNYDERKWAVAAAAAKRVMDMGLYSLHTVSKDPNTLKTQFSKFGGLPEGVPTTNFPKGAGDIDPYRSYSDMFTGEAVAFRNPEFVWGKTSSTLTAGVEDSFSAAYGGWNGMCVTQKVIDAFYMRDGRDINDYSDDFPYSEEGFTTQNEVLSTGIEVANGINNMYANREVRFYASVGYCERIWVCNSTSENQYRNWRATYYYGSGGNSGKYSSQSNPDDFPATGYVITKYIHTDDAKKGANARILPKAFGIIRYAEILLSYAEALNNLTKSYTIEMGDKTYTVDRTPTEIQDAFNQIRYRVALPGMSNEDVQNPATVQELIERERMIEFLFENRRFYDVRRWGIYEETESEPIMGMNMNGGKDEFYQRTVVDEANARNRIVDTKLIFVPIPRDEIRKMPDMDQNPGWDS